MSRTKRKKCEEYKEDQELDTSRDGKKWYKPNKEYKKFHRKKEKAEIKDSLRKGKYDALPIHKKQDEYDWN